MTKIKAFFAGIGPFILRAKKPLILLGSFLITTLVALVLAMVFKKIGATSMLQAE